MDLVRNICQLNVLYGLIITATIYLAGVYYGPSWYACQPTFSYLLNDTLCEGKGSLWLWPGFFTLDFLAVLTAISSFIGTVYMIYCILVLAKDCVMIIVVPEKPDSWKQTGYSDF